MSKKLLDRKDVDKNYTWDLTKMFTDNNAWSKAYEELVPRIEALSKLAGTLGESSNSLLEAIEEIISVRRQLSNIYVYASMYNDQDTTDADGQLMFAKGQQLYAKFGETVAFFNPEILAIGEDKLNAMLEENEELAFYRHFLDDIIRFKDYTLSYEKETLLAQASDALSASSDTFAVILNADLKFGDVTDSDGSTVQLSHGSYGRLIASTDRNVRKEAFQKYYSVFDQFKNTLASTLSGHIKAGNFKAKARGYKSARHMYLYNNNIPEEVYDRLLEVCNTRIDSLHRFVELRRDLLELPDLQMYDMYTPLLGEAKLKFTYDEAREVVLEALAPLGEEYLSIVERCFDERWIDVYENVGKRSGAYSSGTYDSYPYILMNWQDNIDSLYTLVHEIGHSVHSQLSNENQSYIYSNYPIFLAEIASTTNENLLTYYLLEKYQDKEVQLYVLNHFLDSVKGTFFRQAQFAEFEHFMYQQEANGKPLTADFLSESYQELNARYYGDAVNSDSEIRLEWSRIPHFYYDYYVFQYATGFCAAVYFSEYIHAGDKEATERYLNFLRAGSSKYPIDIMKGAGLDMTKTDYMLETLDLFDKRLEMFKDLLGRG